MSGIAADISVGIVAFMFQSRHRDACHVRATQRITDSDATAAVSISQSRCLSGQVTLSLLSYLTGVPSFNLAIEMLVMSGYT